MFTFYNVVRSLKKGFHDDSFYPCEKCEKLISRICLFERRGRSHRRGLFRRTSSRHLRKVVTHGKRRRQAGLKRKYDPRVPVELDFYSDVNVRGNEIITKIAVR